MNTAIMLNLVLPSLWEKEMGKLLHIGVSNKYRSACTQGISQDKGKCYKKWDASSSKVKTYYPKGVHPVKKGTCMHFIGDRDSSVYSTLIPNVPSGAMQAGRLNVQTMPASAIVQVWKACTSPSSLQRQRRTHTKNEAKTNQCCLMCY